MENPSANNKQLLKELNSKLKTLQTELVEVNKLSGIDEYITVKVKDNQGHFERIKKRDEEDKAIGKFFIKLDITAKSSVVYIPLSIASGKKPTGFMYQIEGTAEGLITTATAKCHGEGITQITLGTLLYVKIPVGKTATFALQATVRGQFNKTYNILISRINYKLNLTDSRYQQYLKPIQGDKVKFS